MFEPSSVSAARPLCTHAQRRYLTYPHANGFMDKGRSVVLAQREPHAYSLWKHDLATGVEALLVVWPRTHCAGDMLWFDISRDTGLIAVVVDDTLQIIDPARPADSPRPLFRANPGSTLIPLPSISADGSRVIVGRRTESGTSKFIDILEMGSLSRRPPHRTLARFDWHANHFHFCPADETWVGFCHEGPAAEVPDRIWAWHEKYARDGRCLFNNGAMGLNVGHERWAFHAPCLFAVAYGESKCSPRGVYQIFADGRPSRLVSEGDRDWHVSPSYCGRWVVVDTTGPYDAPGRGWADAADRSDILLVDVSTGERQFLARSRFRRDFHLHPHPVFTPDGNTILYNEADSDPAVGHRVLAVANPWRDRFLATPPPLSSDPCAY